VTKYLNEHPGGPEIIMDFAGKDADDMFEDIGHSTGARDKLKSLLIGELKYDPTKVKSKAAKAEATAKLKAEKAAALKAEKAAIKAGRIAAEIWPDEPARAAKKDTDAHWTLKFAKARPLENGKPGRRARCASSSAPSASRVPPPR
jgi:hypothetical protein